MIAPATAPRARLLLPRRATIGHQMAGVMTTAGEATEATDGGSAVRTSHPPAMALTKSSVASTVAPNTRKGRCPQPNIETTAPSRQLKELKLERRSTAPRKT